jgi:putative endonuclease
MLVGVAAKDAIGRYGEDVAARHLTDAGLVILDRNWRCPAGELDIVATDGAVLVFVEVKTRSSTLFGVPAEAVIGAKAARVRRLALAWIAARRESGDTDFWAALRFDVVSVLRQRQGAASVDHLVGAF